jgi:hypothetical protein
MAEAALVTGEIEGGRRAVDVLERAGMEITSALWLLDETLDTWLLVLGTPDVDRDGRRATYERVLKELAKQRVDVPVTRIQVKGSTDEFWRSLRKAIRGRDLSVRFTNNVIGDRLIPDAFIYRST